MGLFREEFVRIDSFRTKSLSVWKSFWKLTSRVSRYVATEDGILEFTVNIDDRKTFPGMALQ